MNSKDQIYQLLLLYIQEFISTEFFCRSFHIEFRDREKKIFDSTEEDIFLRLFEVVTIYSSHDEDKKLRNYSTDNDVLQAVKRCIGELYDKNRKHLIIKE